MRDRPEQQIERRLIEPRHQPPEAARSARRRHAVDRRAPLAARRAGASRTARARCARAGRPAGRVVRRRIDARADAVRIGRAPDRDDRRLHQDPDEERRRRRLVAIGRDRQRRADDRARARTRPRERRDNPAGGDAAHAASTPVRPTCASAASTARSSRKSTFGAARRPPTWRARTSSIAGAGRQPRGQRLLADLGPRRVEQLKQRRRAEQIEIAGEGMAVEKPRAVGAGAGPRSRRAAPRRARRAAGRDGARSIRCSTRDVDDGEHGEPRPGRRAARRRDRWLTNACQASTAIAAASASRAFDMSAVRRDPRARSRRSSVRCAGRIPRAGQASCQTCSVKPPRASSAPRATKDSSHSKCSRLRLSR